VARKIDSGICHVNGPTVHDEAQMPFGGIKGSGIGRFGGKAGVAELPSCAGSRCKRSRGTIRSERMAPPEADAE
jgi:acyl-CoA reductase-like NAD-dependent aldehyde dehydrogenase